MLTLFCIIILTHATNWMVRSPLSRQTNNLSTNTWFGYTSETRRKKLLSFFFSKFFVPSHSGCHMKLSMNDATVLARGRERLPFFIYQNFLVTRRPKPSVNITWLNFLGLFLLVIKFTETPPQKKETIGWSYYNEGGLGFQENTTWLLSCCWGFFAVYDVFMGFLGRTTFQKNLLVNLLIGSTPWYKNISSLHPDPDNHIHSRLLSPGPTNVRRTI